MTDIELVSLISHGHTIKEISKESKFDRRTLEKRVLTLRQKLNCATVSQLVATYFRKRLIE